MDPPRARLLSYWKVLVVLLAPLLLLPIPLLWRPEQGGAAVSRTLYVILVMAVYWVTEALPLTVTALVPLLALPLLQIATAKQVATHYLTDSSWLFIGSLVVAVAVEDTGLHRRIALSILRVTGSQPRWLMIGIMCCTALLSMFISNTATTAMMVPVVLSLAAELVRTGRLVDGPKAGGVQLKRIHKVAPAGHGPRAVNGRPDNAGSGVPPTEGDVERSQGAHEPSAHEEEPERVVMERSLLSAAELRLTKSLLLATSYAASLGGTATLTGTPPNIVMKGLLDDKYGSGHPINYATWMGYNFPGMLINIVFAWHWLQLLYFGPRALVSCGRQSAAGAQAVRAVIGREVAALGRWTFAEVSILCWFAVALMLWLTREIAGWGSLFDGSTTANVTHANGSWTLETTAVPYVSDGTCIMLICLALFIWPRHVPLKRERKGGRCHYALAPFAPLLTWQSVQQRLPWGIVLLLGGGFALAKASQKSGLSALIASQLAELDVSPFWICLLSLVLMTYLTEFTSNTATSQIVLPVTMDLAQKRCFNPLYLTMPVSEAASFAYMLPVATPPNAIVFSSGLLTVVDMMLAGSAMNVFCMLEVLLSIHTWGWHMFDIGTYPKWAVLPGDNATLNCYLQQSVM